MPDEPSDDDSGDLSVRLSWPKAAGEAPPAPAAPVAPVQRPATPARAVRKVQPRAATARVAAPAVPAAHVAPEALGRPAPARSVPTTPEPTPTLAFEGLRREARTPEALPQPPLEGVPAGRAFVDAFDRLADRLLDRLRTLRQEVDGDLAGVRTELAALRAVIDELGDRSQLRQVMAAVEELRTELASLRRAVLEWPELEQVSSDIAAVRGDIAYLFETSDGTTVAPPSELLQEQRSTINLLSSTISTFSDEISRMSEELDRPEALKALVEEMASIRSELTEVRRMRSARLDPGQLDDIAAVVAERVLDELRPPDAKRRRR